jgi:putative copper resistance protein D
LPLAKLVFHLAAAGTIGALVLAAFALSPIDPAQKKALRIAGVSAAVWALAAAVFSLLNFHNIANKPLSSQSLGPDFVLFLTAGLGRPGGLCVVITAAVSLLCFSIRGVPMVLVTALLAFAGLVPLVLSSHATGGGDHVESTTSVVLHIGAAAVWLGGLLVLAMLGTALPPGRLNVAARRFSTLALICFIVVGISGLLSARAGLGSLDQLGTPYGGIVLAKAAAFTLLGIVGSVHRQWILNRLDRDPDRGARYFTVLVVAELAVLGAASGMAAALARTEVPSLSAAAAERLPEPALWSYLTQWEPDPLWLLLCAFGAFLYLAGVRRIRLAGGSWPMSRTMLWLAGMAVLFTVTNGGVHVYQGFLFSAHVLTQMLLTALVPLLLVPAAPLTLAERTIRSRTDGSTGAREMIRSAVRPVLAAATAAPYVPALVIALSLNAFYFTPLLELGAITQLGFSAMTLLALLSGCLFTAAMTGAVQGDRRQERRWRLAVLAVTAGVYAVYGRALSTQAAELEQPWYFAVGQPWGASGAASPELGGPVMWAISAATLAVIALMVSLPRTPEDQAPDSGREPVPESAKRSTITKGPVRP